MPAPVPTHYQSRNKWLLLAEFWRSAAASPTGELQLQLETIQEAATLQDNLYRALRRAKGNRYRDEELVAAAANISITRRGSTLILYTRRLSRAMIAAREQAAKQNPAIAATLASLPGITKLPETKQGSAAATPKPANTYFERERQETVKAPPLPSSLLQGE